MKLKKTSVLFLIALIISAFPYAYALFDNPAESLYVSTFSKTALTNGELCFTAQDFISKAVDAAALDGVVICDLPTPSVGVLKFAGRDVESGEAFSVNGLNYLKFVPYSTSVTKTDFTFIPIFRSGSTGESVRVNINVLAEANDPPLAENLEVTTAKNIAVCGAFKATDPEGDALTFKITESPSKGTAEPALDNPYKFIYKPFQNVSGDDKFTYVAIDALGNMSAPAEVHVSIKKATLSLTYADLSESGIEYQAAVLADAGILRGEKLGYESFLRPDAAVSRCEFIAMLASIFELDRAESVIRFSEFDDMESAPSWARGYIASAFRSSIVQGTSTPHGTVFRPTSAITRGEAAVMLSNALNTDTANATWTDSSAPVWASEAAAEVAASGILARAPDGTMALSSRVTRRDAVELLYNTLCSAKK